MSKKESASNDSPKRERRGGKQKGDGLFIPSPEQRGMVEASVGFGHTYDEICQLIINPLTGKPICKHTLIKAFPLELERGKVSVKTKVMSALFKNATEHNNVAAQIFFLKQRARWNKGESEDDDIPEVQVIEGDQNELEAARRVAFMLAKGALLEKKK